MKPIPLLAQFTYLVPSSISTKDIGRVSGKEWGLSASWLPLTPSLSLSGHQITNPTEPSQLSWRQNWIRTFSALPFSSPKGLKKKSADREQ